MNARSLLWAIPALMPIFASRTATAAPPARGSMTTPKKAKKTSDISSRPPRVSLQFLGLYLAIASFFLAIVGFIGIFTSDDGTGVFILVVGGVMTAVGVVLGRSKKAAKIVFWQ